MQWLWDNGPALCFESQFHGHTIAPLCLCLICGCFYHCKCREEELPWRGGPHGLQSLKYLLSDPSPLFKNSFKASILLARVKHLQILRTELPLVLNNLNILSSLDCKNNVSLFSLPLKTTLKSAWRVSLVGKALTSNSGEAEFKFPELKYVRWPQRPSHISSLLGKDTGSRELA